MELLDADLKQRLHHELNALEYERKKYSARLGQLGACKDAFLRRSRSKNGKCYFSVKRSGYASYSYLGTADHPEVKRVQEARFLSEAISRIDHNIDLIKTLLTGFLPYDQSSVNENLPESYRCVVAPVSDNYKRESERWLSERKTFQKEFPENYPQHKKHRTSDGIMVKTISEVVLYERFKAAGFAQIYELPFIPVDHGPVMYPDLSILSPIDMKSVILVEYVGRMDLREYREEFARKLGRYIASGYVPGVNLFLIFSDRDGNIDSMQITKVINDIRGMYTAA